MCTDYYYCILCCIAVCSKSPHSVCHHPKEFCYFIQRNNLCLSLLLLLPISLLHLLSVLNKNSPVLHCSLKELINMYKMKHVFFSNGLREEEEEMFSLTINVYKKKRLSTFWITVTLLQH